MRSRSRSCRTSRSFRQNSRTSSKIRQLWRSKRNVGHIINFWCSQTYWLFVVAERYETWQMCWYSWSVLKQLLNEVRQIFLIIFRQIRTIFFMAHFSLKIFLRDFKLHLLKTILNGLCCWEKFWFQVVRDKHLNFRLNPNHAKPNNIQQWSCQLKRAVTKKPFVLAVGFCWVQQGGSTIRVGG